MIFHPARRFHTRRGVNRSFRLDERSRSERLRLEVAPRTSEGSFFHFISCYDPPNEKRYPKLIQRNLRGSNSLCGGRSVSVVHSRNVFFHAALLPPDDELDSLSLAVRMPRLPETLLHVSSGKFP